MTPDEITQLAHQAGLTHYVEQHSLFDARLFKLAQLVAAKEREACAKVCDQFDAENPFIGQAQAVANAIRERGNT